MRDKFMDEIVRWARFCNGGKWRNWDCFSVVSLTNKKSRFYGMFEAKWCHITKQHSHQLSAYKSELSQSFSSTLSISCFFFGQRHYAFHIFHSKDNSIFHQTHPLLPPFILEKIMLAHFHLFRDFFLLSSFISGAARQHTKAHKMEQ